MRKSDFDDFYALEENLWWFAGMRDITAALLDSLPVAAGANVLDAGCGTGLMLTWLKRNVTAGTVLGIDLDPTALSYTHERGHAQIARASVGELPFPSQTFDLVTSFDVLVQLPGAEMDTLAIREMFRVLKPGGFAFVRAAAYKWMRSGHDEALGTQRRYNLADLAGRLEREGFRVIRATYANTWLFPLAVVRRLLLKRVGLANAGSDVRQLPRGVRWMNGVLHGVLRAEAGHLRRPGSRYRFGLSAICVAQRPS
ncbi:MAG TPA: class I SAM-dependent methyltransferase [Actinomycetota bacterium]|jgi:ubiquinone/menaquinone biosynthesis C-methylase UbiE|nr:class I SAM-dependent methyltransferase [Actinomycetota bacterium]